MKIKKSELQKIIASEISAFLGKRGLGSSSMDKNQLRIDGESEPLKDKTLLTKLVKDLKTMMSKTQVNKKFCFSQRFFYQKRFINFICICF